MYIKFDNNDYTVKIDTNNFILGAGNLEYAIGEILSAKWKWFNFVVGEKLWYNDGSEYLTCKGIDHVNGTIVFI